MEKAYKLEFANEQEHSLSVSCCGCSRTEPLHSFGPALKPHFLIHYVLSGRGTFSVRGQEYGLEAGSGFLIEPGGLVFYQADGQEPWTYVWVGFGGSQAGEYVRKMGLSGGHPVFHSERQEELYACVRNMMEHNTSAVADELRRNGELAVFLSLIVSDMQLRKSDDVNGANTYVKKAIGFIRQNYCNPIRVTDVAEFVCVNRSYLCSLFKDSMGISPQKFLAAYRITRAAELLQTTDIPIESIGLSCGYNDAIVFTKAFRQDKGVSPSCYRKSWRESGSRHNREQLLQIEDLIRKSGKGKGGKQMEALHVIENEYMTVKINDAGAELWELWNKKTGEQIIWDGRPEVWNRRTPVLFPFVGRVTENAYVYQGNTYPMGQHGFARDMRFAMVEKGDDYVIHELRADAGTKKRYPFDFAFRVTHRLDGENLLVAWEVKNCGDETMYFRIGGHPGFALPDMEKEDDAVYSLYFPGQERLTYLLVDMATGLGKPQQTWELSLSQGRCPIGRHMFDQDALVFDGGQITEVSILRPDGSQYVTLAGADFASFGIWAKPGAPFVCLEPWAGRCDNQDSTQELEQKPGMNRLEAGGVYTNGYRIGIGGNL